MLLGVADLPSSFLDEVFQRFLLVKRIGQLETDDKFVGVTKPFLCKIIARKDIISKFPMSNFERPQSVFRFFIFVDRFCSFFYHQSAIGVLKNICSKNMV